MLFMTNGYSQDIYGSKLTLSGDHTLTDQEKCLVVSINMTAASKTVILGVADGDAMTVINIGSNTFTVKNIAGDTGTSLEANGMVTVIGGGDTADAAKFITGGGGGGGGGDSGVFKVTITADYTDPDNPTFASDKTSAEIAAAAQTGAFVYAAMSRLLMPLTACSQVGDDFTCSFTSASFDGDEQGTGFDLTIASLWVDENDDVTFTYMPYIVTAEPLE